jgi:hypothetical protein
MASNKCDRVNRCKNSWWCAVDYNPANNDCFEPMTHGDVLRAKSDEELAWAYAYRLASCYGCEASTIEDCVKCTLDWLRQEDTDG